LGETAKSGQDDAFSRKPKAGRAELGAGAVLDTDDRMQVSADICMGRILGGFEADLKSVDHE